MARPSIGLDELLARFAGLERAEILRWVENRWVLPDIAGEQWVFQQVDVARVELIRHVRDDLAVNDEAMTLVLGLLDQVYDLRRQMRRLCDAVEALSPDAQAALRQALPKGRE
jgi:chaperone modulatory protein CbpM